MTVVVDGQEFESARAALEDMMRDVDNPEALSPVLRLWVEDLTGDDSALCNYRLRHPAVYSVVDPLLPHQCNKMLAQKWEHLKREWRSKNWAIVIALHERPYRMQLLEKLYFTDRITTDEMQELLLHFWTDTEIPQANQDDPLWLFRAAGFSTDDQEGFDALPAILQLYRGIGDDGRADGVSWTTDRKVADFFAKRFGSGTTCKISVEKDSPGVLAWITDRSENEIILDFEQIDSGPIEIEEDFNA